MAHGYRTLQHWNQWLTQQYLGPELLKTEQELLTQLLNRHFGKHVLLIGVPNQYDLLNSTKIPCHTLISPLMYKENQFNYIESDFHELPILTGSIDLVMLPHTLEFVDNPRQLLAEACRIIKPEGLILICGFNPYSTWGLKKKWGKHKAALWMGNLIQANMIKAWLQLADFAMEQHKSALFRPPVQQGNLYKKLQFLEGLGNKCFPVFGGVYALLARAKVIPLTPIKLKWKQNLGGIRVSTSISGHIARSSQ